MSAQDGVGPESKHVKALVERGLAARISGDIAAALRLFREALSVEPRTPRVLELLLDVLRGRESPSNDVFLSKLRHRLVRSKDDSATIASMVASISCRLGEVSMERGNLEQGLAELQGAAGLGDAQGVRYLGQALQRLRRLSDAREVYERYAANLQTGSPEWSEAIAEAARVALELEGNPEAAIGLLNQLLTWQPTHREWRLQRAYARVVAEQFAEAKAEVCELIEEEAPSSARAEACFYAGQIANAQDNPEEARQYYEDALGHAPAHSRALLALLRTLWKCGAWEAFDEVFTRYRPEDLAPKDRERFALLCGAALEGLRPERAQTILAEALREAETPALRARLALTTAKAGDAGSALAILLEGVRNEPDNAELLRACHDLSEILGRPLLSERARQVAELLGTPLSPGSEGAEKNASGSQQRAPIHPNLTSGPGKVLRQLRASFDATLESFRRERGSLGYGDLSAEAQYVIRAAQDRLDARLEHTLPHIESQVAGGAGIGVVLSDRLGERCLTVYLDADHTLGPWGAGTASMLLARGLCYDQFDIEHLATLPPEVLVPWVKWMYAAGRGESAAPPAELGEDTEWRIEITPMEEHDPLEVAKTAHKAALETGDRACLEVASLSEAIRHVIELELGIATYGAGTAELALRVRESTRSRDLLVHFLASS